MASSARPPLPTLDLKAQFATIGDEIRTAIERVLASQHFIMGPEVAAFEDEVAGYLGCARALGVSSGTDALLAALMALDVGPGDRVVTSTFTFFATAGAVHRLGATPVFVDIEPDTFNLDPACLADVDPAGVKAIIPVHLYGRCARMGPITDWARAHGAAVIEDAAQAIGAEAAGRRAGTLGDMACFSFFPSKNLGALGDGGMITTDDPELGERLAILRVHGARPKYHHHVVGGNFRLDAIQAAVLRVKLRHLDDWNGGRRAAAARFDDLLTGAGLVGGQGPVLALPAPDSGDHQVFHQYVIRVGDRDALADHLKALGIGTAVYYPVPLHLQACFADLGYRPGDLPVSEQAAGEVLALPMFPELTDDQQRRVVDAIAAFPRK
jgi:dTDP-4-amino-4,6-dideoxygalactose transaminase